MYTNVLINFLLHNAPHPPQLPRPLPQCTTLPTIPSPPPTMHHTPTVPSSNQYLPKHYLSSPSPATNVFNAYSRTYTHTHTHTHTHLHTHRAHMHTHRTLIHKHKPIHSPHTPTYLQHLTARTHTYVNARTFLHAHMCAGHVTPHEQAYNVQAYINTMQRRISSFEYLLY